MTREVYLKSHPHRVEAQQSARRLGRELAGRGVTVRETGPLDGADILVVLGGDGSILSAAEMTRGTTIPILGINYGHVGFLAEADPQSLPTIVDQIAGGQWSVDRRMTLAVTVTHPDGRVESSWAVNEASLEKSTSPMIAVSIGVDSRGVSSFSCDSVLAATPTGSTAYAFSAGGPVVWPDVEAMLFVPVAAHALFTRPLVVSPDSTISVLLESERARLFCDGRRELEVTGGSTVTVTRAADPVYLARLSDTPFSGRLVKKFSLPVHGFRGERA